MPSFPPDIIETLRRSIELADPEHARTMTGLLARLQIQHSRLREAVANNRLRADEHWTDELFTDALEIYARISDLFDYARPQETMQESEPDRAAMSNALFNCGFFDEKPEVSRMIQERYEE
jgi:hypothetical protein